MIKTIIRDGKKFVVLSAGDFDRLLEDVDMLADIRSYDAAKARLARGEDEEIPFSIITRQIAGENPVASPVSRKLP